MHEPVRSPAGLLLLPRLRVQNANTISSPLTWGFPPPSAFLGFVHALERRLADRYGQVFAGVGIVCHGFEPQTFKPNRRQHQVFAQSRNPIYLKTHLPKFIADGTPGAIVEQGRAHLDLSLVIGLAHSFDDDHEGRAFGDDAYEVAQGMRLAGGSILPPQCATSAPMCCAWPEFAEDQRTAFQRLRRRLLPGFALVHRPDLLAERLAGLQSEGAASVSVLDALLDLTRLNHYPAAANSLPAGAPETRGRDADAKTQWRIAARPGWLVPIPIGYAGISPLYAGGEVANTRDAVTPFRFVESLYSLGQWIGPHRLNSLGQFLWHGATDVEAGLYRCVNGYTESPTSTAPDIAQGAQL